jgi:hypothetical protein
VVRSDNPGYPSDNNEPLHSHPFLPPELMNAMLDNIAAATQRAASPATHHSPTSSTNSPGPLFNSAEPRRQSRRECAPIAFSSLPALRRLDSGTDSLTDLVPNVLSPAVPGPNAATTTLSPISTSAGQAGQGPASKNHNVPPRPKPGRKPATEEPESKRKAQNRQSQRNFRQRKQKNVMDLQQSLNAITKQYEDATLAHARELDSLNQQINALAAEKAALLEQTQKLQTEAVGWKTAYFDTREKLEVLTGQSPNLPLHYPHHDPPLRRAFDTDFNAQALVPSPQPTDLGCDRCTKDHCACLAEMTNDAAFQGNADAMTGVLRGGQGEPDDDVDQPRDHSELETDFTSAFRKPKPRDTNSAGFLPSAEDTKFPDCGFCADQPDSCICKSMRSEAADATASLPPIATASSAERVKPNVAMSGPGSCADCQANPEQRAWCQRVAQLRSEATPPNSRRNSSKSVALGTMEPKASTSIDMSSPASSPISRGDTVGCSDAFKLLVGRVDTEMDWRQLKPVPPTFAQEDARKNTFTMEPGMYSVMELDASSILTTLQHAPGPIKPRPSDGTYARLVQEAEERRRKSSTPMKKSDDHLMLDCDQN